ncbi:MAG: FAD-dependent oxidoreductase [Thermoplasmata archaeon]|nr:FAD-dependent oxidoreductase [Thermoplasmata archaeon]
MEHYDLVVIGGVAAGTKAAAKTRREKRDWKIIVITQDHDVSYAGCGLPYYLGGVITTRDQLVVKTPESHKEFSNLDIMVRHEVTDIDRSAHTVSIKDMISGQEFQLGYGKLFLATGAEAIVPPISGADLDRVHTLRSVRDADSIMAAILDRTQTGTPVCGHATIIGAGFIGIEMAENMKDIGWDVTIVEMLPQILPPFDMDMALHVEKHMVSKGVKILTGHQVKSIGNGPQLTIETTGENFPTDLVIMSIGVRPNNVLAKKIGLELGIRGAIKVDQQGRTSDPDIFSAGDCATTVGTVSGSETWIPMGSTANKQARISALTLTGDESSFPGALGTIAVKAFEMSAAKTGLNEREANNLCLNSITVMVPANDRAHYYPGSKKICIKLIAEKTTGRLLGAQIIGLGVVDKPIDAIVVALVMKATVHDLANMDFAYAPPFSTAINPINLACHVMINKLSGRLDGLGPTDTKEMIESPDWDGLLLDIRMEPEFILGTIPGAVNIPLAELESRLAEIEQYKDKDIIVICNHGKDAYEGYLRLKHWGFTRTKLLEGGAKYWPYKLE